MYCPVTMHTGMGQPCHEYRISSKRALGLRNRNWSGFFEAPNQTVEPDWLTEVDFLSYGRTSRNSGFPVRSDQSKLWFPGDFPCRAGPVGVVIANTG
jgi:hypothetical protein